MKTQTIRNNHKTLKAVIVACLLLFLALTTTSAQAQSTERKVSGVVKTFEGIVPGAAIVLKGTSIGVAADDEGAFTFPQPLKENDVLIVSSLAFDDIEVTIEANTTYIEPFLEGNPVTIIAALRTAPSAKKTSNKQ